MSRIFRIGQPDALKQLSRNVDLRKHAEILNPAAPVHVFVIQDTTAAWNKKRRPLKQLFLCIFFGESRHLYYTCKT